MWCACVCVWFWLLQDTYRGLGERPHGRSAAFWALGCPCVKKHENGRSYKSEEYLACQ